MIIVGAKGFAKEVLEVLFQNKEAENLAFFDNINSDIPSYLYDKFPVLKSELEVKTYIEKFGASFCLGIGGTIPRQKMSTFFYNLGCNLTSIISPFATIGNFGNRIGNGICIMTGVRITNDVAIGEGSLINLNCTIGHDVVIGRYCELSPGVHVSGHCNIEDYVTIGTGAVIIPGINIGSGSIIAAGSVITKDVMPKTLVAGVPGVFKKNI